jgi:ectoine hydroxylase-related dioxygenase (phytanoyl-CoA dioxygenase family)
MSAVFSEHEIAAFQRDGYACARALFDAREVELLRRAMEDDPAVREHMLDRADGEGGATRIALWNRAGNSVYGLAARSRRMVDSAEALLGGAVYHYQSKLTAKNPRGGGAWEWHQDFGYWYYNGCLFPQLVSCMVALDRSDRDVDDTAILAAGLRFADGSNQEHFASTPYVPAVARSAADDVS